MQNEIKITDRDQINELFKARLGMKVSLTDEQWEEFADLILGDDWLWQQIDEIIHDALTQVTTPLIETL